MNSFWFLYYPHTPGSSMLGIPKRFSRPLLRRKIETMYGFLRLKANINKHKTWSLNSNEEALLFFLFFSTLTLFHFSTFFSWRYFFFFWIQKRLWFREVLLFAWKRLNIHCISNLWKSKILNVIVWRQWHC